MSILIMMRFLTGVSAVSGGAFKAAWARGCNTVISEGEPR